MPHTRAGKTTNAVAAKKAAAAARSRTVIATQQTDTSLLLNIDSSFDNITGTDAMENSQGFSETDQSGTQTPVGRRSSAPILDLEVEEDSEHAMLCPTPSNVVVCVRIRPAPTTAANGQSNPWKITEGSATIEATENHPSLTKRALSSAPPSLSASASSSFLAEKFASAGASDSDAYKYTFDSVLPPTSTDLSSLYSAHISPVVQGAVQGYNGTVFAYGQTGSGKTFTMSGGGKEKGIIGRAIDEVFDCVGRDPIREFLLRVSYLEIYNESLRDLLVNLPSSGSMVGGIASSASSSSSLGGRPASPTKGGFSHHSSGGSTLRIQEQPNSGRITIAGLREELVTSAPDIISLLDKGQAARHQAATDWNERSSRSHCVATLTIESRKKEGGDGVRISALNLIDLAGSERAASEKERRKEGAFINKSLLTLGSVISKLSAAASNPVAGAHIPYRDSKLTRLLQTSLSGNARVAVLLTLSPLPQHAVEGLSTLKFGRRCKMIKLRARRAEVKEGDGANEALLRRYKREVERLQAKLEGGNLSSASHDNDLRMQEIEEQRKAAASEVEGMTLQKAELRAQIEHLTRLILTGKSVAEVAQEQSTVAGLKTPVRQRGRASEFGTLGTPKTAISLADSPRKHPLSSTLRSSSQSFQPSSSATEGSEDEGAKPFAKEVELVTLRRNLADAIEAKIRAEEVLNKEVECWQQRVGQLKDTLKKRELEWHTTEQRIIGRSAESKRKLEEEITQLQTEVGRLTDETSQREKEMKELRDDAQRKVARLQENVEEIRSDLEEERQKRVEAEEMLSKRPETDEERVQNEFDELVKGARAGACEQRPSTRRSLVAKTADERRRLEARSKELVEREGELERREFELAEEAAKIKVERESTKTVPDCEHPAVISALQKDLDELRLKLANLTREKPALEAAESKLDNTSLPKSPSKLREAFPMAHTPFKTSHGLSRRGSAREYRRYRAPLPSSPSTSPLASASSLFLPALALASSPVTTQAPALLEAALRNEREEVTRLNEVINGQRTLMSDLERSVAEWQKKMKEQQEIIRMLIEDIGQVGSGMGDDDSKLPTPPMQEGENIPVTPPPMSAKRSVSRSLVNTPLRASARISNGATPPSTQRGTPSGRTEEFLKRRSAFLFDSDGGNTFAKLRGGSAMPVGASSPYYGAHMFNRPPTANHSLGVTAPNSPTKGSGLWGSGAGAGPEPLPLPGSLTPNTKRKQRRLTIEHELEALKNGSSPRVDERTRGLLDSPKRVGVYTSSAASEEPRKNIRDWYI